MSSDYCKPTPFVIFLQGRTGSTFLVECLDSHPRIQCDTERLVGFRKHGADKQLQWSSQYLDRSGKCDLGAVGFKTKLEDVLDPKRFTLLLQQLDARILVTQRRNIVKLIVSWFNSERVYDATGAWNVYDNVLAHEPMLVDPQEFDSRLKSVVDGKERLDNFVQGLGLQSLPVDYENLLVNQEKTLQDVCSHLKVPYHTMTSKCAKATSDDLRSVIGNFEELRSHYRGTTYEPMFEEILLK